MVGLFIGITLVLGIFCFIVISMSVETEYVKKIITSAWDIKEDGSHYIITINDRSINARKDRTEVVYEEGRDVLEVIIKTRRYSAGPRFKAWDINLKEYKVFVPSNC